MQTTQPPVTTHTHTHTHKLPHICSQMPEFRFRRRKPQNRRHTLHDAEESAAQIKAAKQQIQSVENGDEVRGEEGEEGKRNSMVQEREKFFELLKHKCSDETTRIELDHVLTNGAEEEEDEEEGEEETLMVSGMGSCDVSDRSPSLYYINKLLLIIFDT